MADFTTWTAYYTALKNDLNNRGFLTKSYRAPDGTFVEYRSIKDMQEAIAYASNMAGSESVTAGQPSRRVHTTIQGDSW